MINAFAKIIARSPPAIAIVIGGMLALAGNPDGMTIVYLGVALQIAWLVLLRRF